MVLGLSVFKLATTLPIANAKQFLRFARPKYLKVVELRAWTKTLMKLERESNNASMIQQGLLKLQALVNTPDSAFKVHAEDRKSLNADPSDAQKAKLALGLMRSYFIQIFHSDSFFCDYAPESLKAGRDGEIVWRPRPLFYRWDENFLEALRHIYLGYYTSQPDLYHDGLAALGLMPVASSLDDIFGGDAFGPQMFSVELFLDRFEALLMECRERDVTLHPDFLVLGLAITTLTHALEELRQPVDSATIFQEFARASV